MNMSAGSAPLIYDVGLHNGDDSAYYLAKGFRVVAIDANPDLCKACRRRFASEISAGQMTILNVGVGEVEGISDFHINDREDAISSFAQPAGDTEGWRIVPASVRRLSSIIEEFGHPF